MDIDDQFCTYESLFSTTEGIPPMLRSQANLYNVLPAPFSTVTPVDLIGVGRKSIVIRI